MADESLNFIGRLSNVMQEQWHQNNRVLRFLFTLRDSFVYQNIAAVPILRKKANGLVDPAEIADFARKAFSAPRLRMFGWRIDPWQVPEELTELLEITKTHQPEYLLEIGTASGGTLFSFSRTASPHATLISVDLPGGKFGAGYPIWRIPYYKSFASKHQKIRLLRRSSHDQNTLKLVKGYLNGAQLDMLFIDGDHTYEGVKTDFQLYSSLVRKGGLVAFHDICQGSFEMSGEVNKFWDEIKLGYAHKEIISNSNQEGFGIGVLYI